MNLKPKSGFKPNSLSECTLLSACDNKENNSTQVEKAVRIPAPTEKAESAVEKIKRISG